jgi:hypothetical protein
VRAALLGPLSALLVSIGASSSSVAAVERVASPTPETVPVTITAPAGRVTVTLRNSPGGGDARIRPQRHFRPVSENAQQVEAAWTRLDTGLSTGADGLFTLAPGASATFEARGTFPAAGTWETALAVEAEGTTPPAFFALPVTRTVPPAQPLPVDFLLQTLPTRIDLPVGVWTTDTQREVSLAARNATSAPLAVASVTLGRVTTAAGQTEITTALSARPEVNSENCRRTLEPNDPCFATMTVPLGLEPGRYLFEVVATGAGGGQSVRFQPVEVRASAWWAAALVASGALLGTIVTGWRQSGRQLVEARILAAERSRQSALLGSNTTMPDARASAENLVERLRELDAQIRRGTTAPDLAPYDGRLQAIASAVRVHAAVERLRDPQQRELLQQALDTLSKALATAAASTTLDPAQTTAIAQAAAALRADVDALDKLVSAVQEADRSLAAVGGPLRRLLQAEALGEAWRALSTAREDALDSTAGGDLNARRQKLESARVALATALGELPAPLVNLVRNLQNPHKNPAIEEAKAKAERLAENAPGQSPMQRLIAANRYADEHAAVLVPGGMEAAAAPTAATVPTLVGPGSALTLDLGGLLIGPSNPASLEHLRRHRTLLDIGTNLAVLAGLGLVGVLTLWAGNPTWGTWTDCATALLAGLGTRLAIGTVAPGS